jgi:hypothetical protein
MPVKFPEKYQRIVVGDDGTGKQVIKEMQLWDGTVLNEKAEPVSGPGANRPAAAPAKKPARRRSGKKAKEAAARLEGDEEI